MVQKWLGVILSPSHYGVPNRGHPGIDLAYCGIDLDLIITKPLNSEPGDMGEIVGDHSR